MLRRSRVGLEARLKCDGRVLMGAARLPRTGFPRLTTQSGSNATACATSSTESVELRITSVARVRVTGWWSTCLIEHLSALVTGDCVVDRRKRCRCVHQSCVEDLSGSGSILVSSFRGTPPAFLAFSSASPRNPSEASNPGDFDAFSGNEEVGSAIARGCRRLDVG